MGFGSAHAADPKIPLLALVASIPTPDANMAAVAAQGGADALLIQVGSVEKELGDLEKAAQAAGDVPCGVTTEAVLPEDVDKLLSAGADFVMLNTDVAPGAILGNESIGKIAVIDPYLDDTLLRALDRLPIDAILVDLDQGNELYLTLREVMACRRIVDMVRKPVMVRVSNKLAADDLANLRDMGVESIQVALSAASSDENLARLRKLIDELPARRKPRDKADVVLPHQRETMKADEVEDDEL